MLPATEQIPDFYWLPTNTLVYDIHAHFLLAFKTIAINCIVSKRFLPIQKKRANRQTYRKKHEI